MKSALPSTQPEGLKELRHALGDGLFTARFGEHNWDVARRILVPVFGPLAISKMFDGTVPSHRFLEQPPFL